MRDSGVYVRVAGRGTVDLIYETTDDEFLNWVGEKVANCGGIVIAETGVRCDPEIRFSILLRLHEHGIEVVRAKGSEYARIIKAQERVN